MTIAVDLGRKATKKKNKNKKINQTTYTITLVTNAIVAESLLFVGLFRAAHDLTSWPSG